MKIYIDPNNPNNYQKGATFPGAVELPGIYSEIDLPYLTVDGESFEVDASAKAAGEDAREMARAEMVMRDTRDSMLADTDFAMTVDYAETLSQSDSDDIKAYRQALRDLPENTPDARSVVYPTKPSALG